VLARVASEAGHTRGALYSAPRLDPKRNGGFGAQMAVLVTPNGLFRTVNMAAIRPLRHVIVYPAIMREDGRI
jgi:hypothetical protein